MNGDDEENNYFSWPNFRFRLLKAVCDEDILCIKSILNGVDIEDENSVRQLAYGRCESCRKALKIRNLELVQILFPIHDVAIGCKFREEINRDLIGAAIRLDYLEGLQYLLSKGLVLDTDSIHRNALEQSIKSGKREVLRYLLSFGEINLNYYLNEKLLVAACADSQSERGC